MKPRNVVLSIALLVGVGVILTKAPGCMSLSREARHPVAQQTVDADGDGVGDAADNCVNLQYARTPDRAGILSYLVGGQYGVGALDTDGDGAVDQPSESMPMIGGPPPTEVESILLHVNHCMLIDENAAAAPPALPGPPGMARGDSSGNGRFRARTSAGRHGAPAACTLPRPAEEIWVIAKAEQGVVAPADENIPGCGELRAKLSEQEVIPLPLKHTAVQAEIAGYIATVAVTQQYENPYSEKIEAVYVFPLPENAAVNEFVMTIGERKIRGIIRERQEAERVYQEARSQGYVASLLTQERPNIFTQSVANIEPGKQIDISINYFHTLAYDDGWYEFVFPMVVGPRFNPPGSTNGIGAVARDARGVSGQKTEVPYLRPNERSGHDIAVQVRLEAGVTLEDLRSVNHQIEVERPAESAAVVQLDPGDAIPNKDFVLRYKVAGDRVKTAVLTHRDERGGFITLMLYPPAELAQVARAPMEMIFVLDCSGSMNGKPIAQAKAAVAQALELMRPDDTFQIIRFSNDASKLGPDPLAATRENLARGRKYLESLNGEGGTMMIEGIKAALDFPHDPRRLRTVAFLTDGYIGNEDEIFTEVHARLGASRIFSFGVGSSVNRYLLDGLARMGQGTVAYLSLNDKADAVMQQYFDRISHPALTDVAVAWGSLGVTEVYPARIPDLFVGRPVVLTGRFAGEAPAAVQIHGRVGGQTRVLTLHVDPTDESARHAGLPAVWARQKIADLSYQALTEPGEDSSDDILAVALEFGLMSNYTAFVAVDSTRVTEGDHGVTVVVPVPVPDGVRYDTTVQERGGCGGVGDVGGTGGAGGAVGAGGAGDVGAGNATGGAGGAGDVGGTGGVGEIGPVGSR